MKRLIRIVAASLVIALAAFGCASNSMNQGWVTLIDGETGLDNFNRLGDANWRGEGGAVMADKSTTKGASVLVSKQLFRDFELHVEFWAGHNTNSGVYIRAPNPNVVNTASGAYEVQIWDKNPNPAYSTGSLVNVAAVQPVHKAGGKWNTYEIYAKGTEITVKLNGTVTVSTGTARTNEGRIALQFNNGDVIKFRKVVVKPL